MVVMVMHLEACSMVMRAKDVVILVLALLLEAAAVARSSEAATMAIAAKVGVRKQATEAMVVAAVTLVRGAKAGFVGVEAAALTVMEAEGATVGERAAMSQMAVAWADQPLSSSLISPLHSRPARSPMPSERAIVRAQSEQPAPRTTQTSHWRRRLLVQRPPAGCSAWWAYSTQSRRGRRRWRSRRSLARRASRSACY